MTVFLIVMQVLKFYSHNPKLQEKGYLIACAYLKLYGNLPYLSFKRLFGLLQVYCSQNIIRHNQ